MPVLAPTFAEVLDVLQEIAPKELAASWDNTGVVLAPRPLRGRVARVLLTIDLTLAVVREAVRARADLVVAYHPPIFKPLARLHHDDARQRVVLAAAAAGLIVHSPHTALDAAPGGLADWLAEGLAGGAATACLRPCGDGDCGRFVELERAVPLRLLLARARRLTGRRQLQFARGDGGGERVRTFAVAAGAGGAVLRGERADLLFTGEMSHHEVLAAVAGGAHVLLAGHSHTERGYLRVLARRLREAFPRLRVLAAATDRDPLTPV